MEKGYFYSLGVENITEIKVIDAFISAVDSEYTNQERNGRSIEAGKIVKPISNGFISWIAALGFLASFLLLLAFYDNNNYIIVALSLLCFIGYGFTFFQLKRSERYIETVTSIRKQVHNHQSNSEMINRFSSLREVEDDEEKI